MTTDHPPAGKPEMNPLDDAAPTSSFDAWPSPLDAQALAALPFRWQDLPVKDRGANAPNYPPAQTFTVGGRQARLQDFIQYNTYAGLLCGIPMHPETEIADAIAAAKAKFPFMTAKPLVIPPRIQVGRRNGQPWAIVPPVATLALFNDGNDMSVAIWFQDAFGLPADQAVLDALAAMDLGVYGVEWEP